MFIKQKNATNKPMVSRDFLWPHQRIASAIALNIEAAFDGTSFLSIEKTKDWSRASKSEEDWG